MRRLAVLSMHTSPLVQPGSGDGGGMNVYVRELAGALARAGIEADVYTRAADPAFPEVTVVEPGFRVIQVPAGPHGPMPKEELPSVVDEFADRVGEHLTAACSDVLHANYWLSGVAAHRLKHELGLPLVSTFHTLARVKAAVDLHEPAGRAEAEAAVMQCSDVICASCAAEVDQLAELYGAPRNRIEIVPPGVDHAFFSPGDRRAARAALGVLGDQPLLLFVGRIQPLKGLEVAVAALAELADHGHPEAELVVVGGPSGPEGATEVAAAGSLVADLGLTDRVRFVDPQPHLMLSTYYRAADVCLVPSRSESFGLVALEAGACGTPVVAAAVGGLPSLVDDGVTGFLVADRAPASYAERVALLLDQPARAGALSRSAAARARDYTWSTTAARLRRLYTDLAATVPVACR
ncbi:MAG TPA: glycosyltransferase [Acidimicrobiales bacterium]